MYDSRQLTLIVSHAAHHLHAVTGNIATALLDTSQQPKMLFSNSALSHISGHKMVTLARDYATQTTETLPRYYKHSLESDVLYFTVLDDRHVFVVIGQQHDEGRVQEFNERLKMLLPTAVV